jgi:hypothetical protein
MKTKTNESKFDNLVNSYCCILLGEKFKCRLSIDSVPRTCGVNQVKFTLPVIKCIVDAHLSGEKVNCECDQLWLGDFISEPLPEDTTPENVCDYVKFLRTYRERVY